MTVRVAKALAGAARLSAGPAAAADAVKGYGSHGLAEWERGQVATFGGSCGLTAFGERERRPAANAVRRCRSIADRVRDDRGSVTAEFAVALPAVVLVLVLALGALQAASLQLRVVDAASTAARMLGRSESSSETDAGVAALIGAHTVTAGSEGAFVCATVAAPLVVNGQSIGVEITARECALEAGL